MRDQVYGIVGDGRVAHHLSHYFRSMGMRVVGWSRRRCRQDGVPLAQVLGNIDVVLLLISDDAIVPFAAAQPELAGRTLVHCSGALVAPGIHGMHPLMTFGPALFPLDRYQAIPFVCDAGGPGFREVFPTLPNPAYALAAEHKGLYHALCVLAGNLTPVLWERLLDTFETRFGLPAAAAMPYLHEVVRRIEGPRPFTTTGPVARGDRHTVNHNLEALADEPLRSVYEGFVRALAPGLLEPEP